MSSSENEDLSLAKESAISRLKEMRKKEFNEGYNFIVENVEYFGLAALEEIAYPDAENHKENLFDRISEFEIVDEIFGYREENYEYFNIHFIVPLDYIKGMNAAAKEMLAKSQQSNTIREQNHDDPKGWVLMKTSEKLFTLDPVDFDNSVMVMDARELKKHIQYAYKILNEFRDQLEKISYENAEREKHG